MSLDLSLLETCCDCGGHSREVFERNVTYNLSPMWHLAVPGRERMLDIEGTTGKQSAPLLLAALQSLGGHREAFEALNPKNGWGSVEVFEDALWSCLRAAVKHPKAEWKAYR